MYGKGTSHCRAGFLPSPSEAYGWDLKGILKEPAEISVYVQHIYSYVLHCKSLCSSRGCGKGFGWVQRRTLEVGAGGGGEGLRTDGRSPPWGPLGVIRPSCPYLGFASFFPAICGCSGDVPRRRRAISFPAARLVRPAVSMTQPPPRG